MENIQATILIAGAGPVGLSLALGLARYGIRSIIVEQRPALSEFSKAAAVLTRTLEIFDAWGIAESFKQNGQWAERLRVCTPKGRTIFSTRFDLLKDESRAAAICLIAQNETERLLYDALTATGLSEVRFGHALRSFETRDDRILSRISAEGSDYDISSNFLCGCDGPRSTVRSNLGMELHGKTYPAHALLADVRLGTRVPGDSPIRIDIHAHGLNAMVNFKADIWRLILALPGEEPQSVPIDLLRERVRAISGAVDFEILWASTFKIHCRNAPAFRRGKVLLLGDAAHLNSPAGGQGMNAGIHDAHNLAWKLAAILNGADEEEMLQSYDEERQEVIRNQVDRFTDRLTRVAILTPPMLRRVAVTIFSLAMRWERFAKAAVRGAGMLYLHYKPGLLVDSSGGMLAERKEGSSIHGRVLRAGAEYIVVRPDEVIAYRGPDRSRADAYHLKFRGVVSRARELPR